MEARPFVLVVDEEKIIADTLVLALQRTGWAAAACYSGAEALVLLRGVRPDAVISEVLLKDVTGIDVAVATHQLSPRCQVVLFSGNTATAELLEQAKAAGFHFECVARPVHPTELLARIGKTG